jgi:hypothetical protein
LETTLLAASRRCLVIELDKDAATLRSAIPLSVLPTLIALAHLTPEGRAIAIGNVGRGTRLVLEVLGVLEQNEPQLTDRGEALVIALANDPSTALTEVDAAAGWTSRLRPIARVVPVQTKLAAYSADVGTSAIANYRLQLDDLEPADALNPAVEVALMDNTLHVWRTDEDAPGTLIYLDTMEEIPRGAGEPLLIETDEDLAPSTVIGRRLAISIDGPVHPAQQDHDPS